MGKILLSLLAGLLFIGSSPAEEIDVDLVDAFSQPLGYTVRKSPVLYVHLSRDTSLPLWFILIDKREVSPIAEILLDSPTRAGFLSIRLKEHRIELEEEVRYYWFVTVAHDGEKQFDDIIDQGLIERLNPFLVDHYGRPCSKDEARYLSKAGIWYDAFACANELIKANPQDLSLHELREELLAQRKR